VDERWAAFGVVVVDLAVEALQALVHVNFTARRDGSDRAVRLTNAALDSCSSCAAITAAAIPAEIEFIPDRRSPPYRRNCWQVAT